MRLIVTRPRKDSLALAGRLEALGHEVLVAPLLEVAYVPPDALDLKRVQALIATSRHALAALQQAGSAPSPRCRGLSRWRQGEGSAPIYCVGKATAAAAHAAGYADVRTGPGTGSELAELIRCELDPAAGALLHLAGEALAVDVAGLLGATGFRVEVQVVYRTEPVGALCPALTRAVCAGWADGVLLMSPRTAMTWAALAEQHGLVHPARRLIHFAISDATARQLARLAPMHVLWPARPDTEDLLALVADAAAKS